MAYRVVELRVTGARVPTATVYANREDANGHYGTLWGRGGVQSTPLSSWQLNDQAAAAVSYLYTAANAGMWDGSDVAARRVFYNRSTFDGNDPAANEADDGAIAADKTALLPGAAGELAAAVAANQVVIQLALGKLDNGRP